MKYFRFDYIIIMFLIIAAIIIYSCNRNIVNNSLPVERQVYDSVIADYNSRLENCFEENLYLNNIIDSIKNVNDSLINNNNYLHSTIINLNDSVIKLNEDLFIAKYKLERISEYNRIAANGNNIVFLRGWINRVLKD